jgi:CHAT domain-containing protein
LGNKEGRLQMLLYIALTYRRQGEFDKAIEYARKGLQLSEEINSNSLKATALSELGSSFASKAETGKALASFKEALSLFQNMNNEIGMCSLLANMALCYLRDNKPQEALPVARQAAAIAKSKGNAEHAWMSHTVLGEVFVSLNNFTQAREAFDEAITYVEMMRTHSAGDESERQRFFEGMVKPYYEMVKLMFAQNKNAEAFYYGERAKGRVLLDVLQNGRADVKNAMTVGEREQEQKLRIAMASLNRQNSQAGQSAKADQAKINDLKARLQKARLEYDGFRDKLYATHPELKVKRGDAQIIKAEETASLLPDANTALLSYLVVDNAAYLFVITKAPNKTAIDLKTYTLPVTREKLSSLVIAFREQLGARDPEFRPSAKQLFDLLLKPAQAQLQGKTNLIISPDAALWELPFQTLLTGANRYLIVEAAISYAPSLTVLREMTKQRKTLTNLPAKTTLLAIGNPFISKETAERVKISRRDDKLDPLPEAEREVKTLAQIYGATQSKIYTGAEAREGRVKAEAGDFKILHFATHGILNDAAPLYSHLVLSQGDKNEDGLLEAWELMETDLNADLVVLSACETARGRVGAGEGVIGLSWALFVAGSPTTVVSQWKVDSAGTSQLMLAFHKSLNADISDAKRRISKAGALREAALHLLKSTDYRHPFYWAGFSVIGDGQ